MKNTLLKVGILLFFYTIIISIHLENSSFYYINYFKGDKGSSENNLTKIDVVTKSVLQIPVNTYLTKEEYLIVKDMQFVANNTRIDILPLKSKRSLFLSLLLIVSITMIILCLDIQKHIKNSSLLLVLVLSLCVYPIYAKIKPNNNFQNSSKIQDRIQNLENEFGNRIDAMGNRIDEIEYNMDY